MENIWGPLYEHSTCEPLTAELIEEAEAQFKVRFPSELIEILKVRNGGFLRNTYHEEYEVDVDQILGIGHKDNSIFDSEWDYFVQDNAGNEVAFPKNSDRLLQLCGDGHFYVCLDYRGLPAESSAPKVSYISPELQTDEVINESFRDFITSLRYSSSSFEYAIESKPDEDVVDKLELAFGLEFENFLNDPSFEACRGQLTSPDYEEIVDPKNPNFKRIKGSFDLVWLRPNADSSGYVLHPSVSEECWIFQLGNTVLSQSEVQDILSKNGFSFRLVHEPVC